MKFTIIRILLSVSALIYSAFGFAQAGSRSFVDVMSTYSVIPDLTYQRAGGVDLKLDVYRPRDDDGTNNHLSPCHVHNVVSDMPVTGSAVIEGPICGFHLTNGEVLAYYS